MRPSSKENPGLFRNNRHMNGEVATWETFFDPVLEKDLEKDILLHMHEATVFH